MRVLVTGGAGFIGSHVVDRLRMARIEPRIFDRRRSPYHSADEVEHVAGDLRDLAALERAMRGCDAVAHLAAAADADAVTRRPADAEEVNSRGTLNVLEAARNARVRRVLYASTIWVYSDTDAAAPDEGTPLGLPAHLYTATKLAGEMYCRAYGELYGLEYTILRFGIPYGPRARPEAVIPTFVTKALHGEPLTVAGDGQQSRRFVYVADLADGVVRALASQGANRIYNLVGHEDVTIREVAETVGRTVGRGEVVRVPARGADFAGVPVSGERAARELGWRASTPFAVGVRRYVAWHRERAPESAAASREPQRARAGAAVRALAQRARAAALVPLVGVTLAAFLIVMRAAGAPADDVGTVAITSLLGLTVYAVRPTLPAGGLLGAGWLTAAALMALLAAWPHAPLHPADSEVHLLLLGLVGTVVGAGTGGAADRVLRPGVSERAADTNG